MKYGHEDGDVESGSAAAGAPEGSRGASALAGSVATNAVHEGKSATPGTNSSARAATRRQRQPRAITRATATTKSRTSSGTESPPPPNTGKKPSCTASASAAIASATFFRLGVIDSAV